MENNGKHTAGSIKVSEEVLIRIAETAASEIEGAIIRGKSGAGLISRLKSPVRVRTLGESAAVGVDITVAEGSNAVKVAESVQHSVKSAIQNMTGFTVTKVDVNIVGVELSQCEAQ